MSERYKIWINIEKITGEGENEVYEDVKPFLQSLGEYTTYEEAQAKIDEIDAGLSRTGNFTAVDRVWDGEKGISPLEAIRKGIKIDCWFLRNDGWQLGAPKEHVESAAGLWKDEWKAVYVLKEGEPAIRLTYQEWLVCSKKGTAKEYTKVGIR